MEPKVCKEKVKEILNKVLDAETLDMTSVGDKYTTIEFGSIKNDVICQLSDEELKKYLPYLRAADVEIKTLDEFNKFKKFIDDIV